MSEDPKLSQQQPKQGQPDIRSLLRPRRAEDKKGVFEAFVSSDKNNPAKSRIPSAPGMAVYQSLGLWGSTKDKFTYEVQGTKKTFTRTTEGLHDLFKRLYDEDAISLDGKSREEGVTAALGYFLQDIEAIQSTQQQRLGEGGGASRSK